MSTLKVNTIEPYSGSEVTLNELTSNSVNITGGSVSGITDLAVADGGTGASTASGARTNLGSTATGDALFTAANAAAARTTLSVYSQAETYTQTQVDNALALKANLASPTFTGTPAAPTAAVNTNTTQLATTAFVLGQATTQADQEAAANNTLYVTPGRQHFHPSAAKAWGKAGVTGNLLAGYNVSSVTDVATGSAQFNYTTSFSSANYAATYIAHMSGAVVFSRIEGMAAGSLHVIVTNSAAAADVDPTAHNFVAFGDL